MKNINELQRNRQAIGFLLFVGFISLSLTVKSQAFVPIGTNDISYDGGPAWDGQVGIAPGNATFPPAFRLDVFENDLTGHGLVAGNFVYNCNFSNGTPGTAVKGDASSTPGNWVQVIGVDGRGSSGDPTIVSSINYGVNGIASGGGKNHGGHFVGSGSTASGAGAENVGAYGEAGSNGADINAGVYGYDGGLASPIPPAILRAGLFKGEVEIQESSTADASLFLNNFSAASKWGLHSDAAAYFEIEENGTNRFFISGGGGTPGRVGIGTTSPANWLHVNVAATGDEGLRVQNTNGSGNACLFLQSNIRTWTLRSLVSGNGDLAFNNGSNIRLFLDGSAAGRVGIGTTAPTARLHVTETIGSSDRAGVFELVNASALTGIGVSGRADAASIENYGVYGTIGTALGSGINSGIYGDDGGNGGGFYSGYFNGDVLINGSAAPGGVAPPGGFYGLTVNGNAITTAGAWYLSDRRFKENINPLGNALEKIQRLNGYYYTFKTEEFKDKKFNSGRQIGFIAQELKEVFPELVNEGNDGYLAVNYQSMIPVLLEAIKEQQKQIDELKSASLGAEKSSGTGISQPGVLGSGFAMGQNEPNPFTYETTVKYSLPQQVQSAYMAVYDLSGKQVTSFQLNERGTSSIVISSENLAAGMYLYSIVADGKIVDSKRMIVAQK